MAVNEVVNKLAAFYKKLEAEKTDREWFHIKERLESQIHQIQKAIIPLESKQNQSEKEKQSIEEIKQGLNKLSDLASKLEDKFSIFVIGDGNVGKSTVVNALLGGEYAKMKFDPMTWKVDVFHNGTEKEAQIVQYDKKGNEVIGLVIDEAKKLIDEEEAKREASIHQIQEKIKEKTDAVQKLCKAQHISYREVLPKL